MLVKTVVVDVIERQLTHNNFLIQALNGVRLTQKLILVLKVHFDTSSSELCLFPKAKPQEDAPEAFITSISDTRLSRVVSKVLSLKNCPAELSPTAMARQVEEVQVRLQAGLLAREKNSD